MVFVSLLTLSSINCVKRIQAPATAGSGASPAATRPQTPAQALGIKDIRKEEFVRLTTNELDKHQIEVPPPPMRTQLIYPGDHLEVSIYEKLPVSQEKRVEVKRVNENGSILIVPIGPVAVSGLTITQAQKTIEEALATYIVSPFCEISVVKREYTPCVYVFGEVNKSGLIQIKRGDRVLDVLSEVGGCKDDAYRRSIKLIRLVDTTVTMYSINLAELMEQGKIDENVMLRDQDILYVPRRFLTTFQEVMSGLSNVMPWYLLIRNF